MIKITLSALVRILANHKIKYVIECVESEDEDSICFVTSDGYPENVGSFISDNSTEGLRNSLHRRSHQKFPLLYYNLKDQMITACCSDWLDLIKVEIKNIENKLIVIQ